EAPREPLDALGLVALRGETVAQLEDVLARLVIFELQPPQLRSERDAAVRVLFRVVLVVAQRLELGLHARALATHLVVAPRLPRLEVALRLLQTRHRLAQLGLGVLRQPRDEVELGRLALQRLQLRASTLVLLELAAQLARQPGMALAVELAERLLQRL